MKHKLVVDLSTDDIKKAVWQYVERELGQKIEGVLLDVDGFRGIVCQIQLEDNALSRRRKPSKKTAVDLYLDLTKKAEGLM